MSQRVFYGGEAMPSHTTRYLGPRQRIRQCAALWIVLSVSLPLLPNRPVTGKADGRATPSSSVTKRPTQQPSYRVTITTGQYLRVVVDQRGIDVALTLFAPD